MTPWAFRDYFLETGGCPIREWYAGQDPAVQVAFDATVDILKATDDWTDPKVKEFKQLSGPHAGLSEILFDVEARTLGARKASKRRFRPVGVLRQYEREFIFLMGCEKSGRIYMPTGAFDTALKLKAALDKGLGAIDEHI